jgi:phosphoribosylformylglycinamidine (FGAM) synthase PurS component
LYRVEIWLKNHLPDVRGLSLVKDIHDLGITTISNSRVADIYWLDADLEPHDLALVCHSLLADPVAQQVRCRPISGSEGKVGIDCHIVEVAYNAGVTDPVEDTIKKALLDLGIRKVEAVKTARRYLIEGRLDEYQLETICNRLLVNPIIQHLVRAEPRGFPVSPQFEFKLKNISILDVDEVGLAGIGRRFGFTNEELRAITNYFSCQGRNPTDAELETLAQTWSEHCVHKTFKGRFEFGNTTIDNLLESTIMKATEELNKPWCLSVFEDNAGVIDFDGRWALCFKVETHNHPSAVV